MDLILELMVINSNLETNFSIFFETLMCKLVSKKWKKISIIKLSLISFYFQRINGLLEKFDLE